MRFELNGGLGIPDWVVYQISLFNREYHETEIIREIIGKAKQIQQ